MLDFAPGAQLTVAAAQRAGKLNFHTGQYFDLFAHVGQFSLQHGLHFRTCMRLLPQSQQLFHFVQRETQFLRVPDKLEVINLPLAEYPVAARAAAPLIDQSELLIETNCVHADAGELRSLSDVSSRCHVHKHKLWSYVQSQEGKIELPRGTKSPHHNRLKRSPQPVSLIVMLTSSALLTRVGRIAL